MDTRRYFTATEAAEALGVSLPTLYAYVSRGMIRSEPVDGSRRSRRYHAEDVLRLRQRREYRHDPAKAASDSMHWGTPVLETELTQITEAGPSYRGRSAIDLARTCTVEEVAALLWTGDTARGEDIFRDAGPQNDEILSTFTDDLPFGQRAQIALALASDRDLTAYDLDPQSKNTVRTGARILRLMTTVLAGPGNEGTTIGHTLSATWCPPSACAERLLNAALILCADHELSASTFVARITASVEANLYGVVTAALAALQGARHGGNTDLVEAFLTEPHRPDGVQAAIAARLRRGERLPGFGHALYPAGDPRAAALLTLAVDMHPDAPEVLLALSVIAAVEGITGRKPNIDFALVTLANILHLPRGSAFALFALGRTAGWIGHAIEQYGSAHMIRPRATYVGKSTAPNTLNR